MRRIFALLLVCAFALGFILGCEEKPTPAPEEGNNEEVQAPAEPTEGEAKTDAEVEEAPIEEAEAAE